MAAASRFGRGAARGAGLIVADGDHGWTVVAGDIGSAVTAYLPASFAELPRKARIIHTESDELLVQATLLQDVAGRPRAAIVATRDLTTELSRYRIVWSVLIGGLVATLLAGLVVILGSPAGPEPCTGPVQGIVPMLTDDFHVFDTTLRSRVAAFQQAQGLTPDGVAGPTTLMQINRASGVAEPWLAGASSAVSAASAPGVAQRK